MNGEETLDPSNWDEVKLLGHHMLDDMVSHLQNVRKRKVWQPMPAEAIQFFQRPLEEEPVDLNVLYEDFKNFVLPFTKGNIHPRFWGWVEGSGSISGVLADMLASGLNSNSPFGDQASVRMEQQVVRWMIELFRFPHNAYGLLTTGGSLANITALTVARNHHQKSVRVEGLRGGLVVYASMSTHSSVDKAIETIGIGTANYRRIPIDDHFQIDIAALRSAIAADKQNGLTPFCIIGNAGTVDTGAIDDLVSLSQIAKGENMWFHVDGAFGAVPKILPEYEDKLAGIELADSLAFDFHKWFYVNYEVGCFLIRDKDIHASAFRYKANYLLEHERGVMNFQDNPHQFGFELSRGFRSLKIWMMLKENGLAKYRRLIRQNIQQARYLKELIESTQQLELLAPVAMNIVCFRYVVRDINTETLNNLNKEILMTMHVDGSFMPSYTLINGKYALRVAITNHRSRKEDFEAFVDEVVRLGNAMSKN